MIKLFNEMEAALKAARPELMVDLVRAGVISSNLSYFREIYLYYDKEIKTGTEERQAKINTADTFGIGESSVYRIIKQMTP